MGCTPSTQLHDDDYSVCDSSSDEDTAGSTARSPRSSQRDVRHWRKVDLECRALSRPPGPPDLDEEETTRPGDRRVSFRENLEDVVQIPPLSEISRSLRLDVYWSGQEFDNLHRQRQRLSVEVARQVLAAAKQGTTATISTEFGGESLRGLGLVDERSLGTIAQRQMRIRERARRVVAAQLDATRSAPVWKSNFGRPRNLTHWLISTGRRKTLQISPSGWRGTTWRRPPRSRTGTTKSPSGRRRSWRRRRRPPSSSRPPSTARKSRRARPTRRDARVE